ncbi:MAG: site-specific DNA-methyltransferase [Pseudomonadota bacterium]
MRIIVGDALTELKKLPSESVHCCVTSPPYFGLRDYRVEGQIGLEASLDDYLDKLVAVFREVRRVLREDGTCWVNIGDSYASGMRSAYDDDRHKYRTARAHDRRPPTPVGLKPKDLCLVPFRLALALQADGWWVRSDIVWNKRNLLPESVTDRPTKSREYIFMLAKAQRYFYDQEAIREAMSGASIERYKYDFGGAKNQHLKDTDNPMAVVGIPSPTVRGRNARSVWTIATQPRPENFYAAFPDELARRCILAGSPQKCCPICGAPWERMVERKSVYDHTTTAPGKSKDGPYAGQTGDGAGTHDIRHGVYSARQDRGFRPTCSCHGNDGSGKAVVLDPFLGRGTTLIVAARYGRDGIGIELNPEYAAMAQRNLDDELRQPWLVDRATM